MNFTVLYQYQNGQRVVGYSLENDDYDLHNINFNMAAGNTTTNLLSISIYLSDRSIHKDIKNETPAEVSEFILHTVLRTIHDDNQINYYYAGSNS